MSSVWDREASGDTEWGRKDDSGLEKGDSDGWLGGGESLGTDENAKPRGFGGDDDMACRICGSSEHFSRNCPNAGVGCFNCGEQDHSRAECPNARKSTGACHNCGQEGHIKSECPEPRKAAGPCYNCGQEGHTKAECPNPRVFKGTCRICNQEGHPAAACPEKPIDVCRNCKAEGHQSKDCKANRKFDLNRVADKLPEEAWAMMKKASDEKDLPDFREALQVYSKAVPDATFVDIEKKLREENFNIFLIALEKEPFDVISLIDLQGRLDRQYVVGFFYSAKPSRQTLRDRWPSDADDNLERLANAGFPYDRQVLKCRNCGEIGHTARHCKQERAEWDKVEIKCGNCGEIGHRVRDCKEKRRNKYGCRNCGSNEHEARECPEPRSAANVECRKCNETGHFAKDCPQGGDQGDRGPRTCRNCGSEDHIARDCDQPRDPSAITCRNCDQQGHTSRECPEPKDWSRVKCNRCGEMGHTVKRCPQPEDSGAAEYGGGGYEGEWKPASAGADDSWGPAQQTDDSAWTSTQHAAAGPGDEAYEGDQLTQQMGQLQTNDAVDW